MLTCREMSELASELLDGRARWSDRVLARLHLLACRFCREYFHQLRLTITTIRSVRPPKTTVDVDKVLEAIDRRTQPQ